VVGVWVSGYLVSGSLLCSCTLVVSFCMEIPRSFDRPTGDRFNLIDKAAETEEHTWTLQKCQMVFSDGGIDRTMMQIVKLSRQFFTRDHPVEHINVGGY
jgi:hypothetical protein